MKWWKLAAVRHRATPMARSGLSGAGAVLHGLENVGDFRHGPLPDGVAVAGRVPTGDVVFRLSFDVGQKRARPKAEETWFEPGIAQLLLHEDEPDQGLLRLC